MKIISKLSSLLILNKCRNMSVVSHIFGFHCKIRFKSYLSCKYALSRISSWDSQRGYLNLRILTSEIFLGADLKTRTISDDQGNSVAVDHCLIDFSSYSAYWSEGF